VYGIRGDTPVPFELGCVLLRRGLQGVHVRRRFLQGGVWHGAVNHGFRGRCQLLGQTRNTCTLGFWGRRLLQGICIRVWCRGDRMRNDVLRCSIECGCRAQSVQRVVVKVFGRRRARGRGGWHCEELKKLIVDLFQFFENLVELVEGLAVAGG